MQHSNFSVCHQSDCPKFWRCERFLFLSDCCTELTQSAPPLALLLKHVINNQLIMYSSTSQISSLNFSDDKMPKQENNIRSLVQLSFDAVLDALFRRFEFINFD